MSKLVSTVKEVAVGTKVHYVMGERGMEGMHRNAVVTAIVDVLAKPYPSVALEVATVEGEDVHDFPPMLITHCRYHVPNTEMGEEEHLQRTWHFPEA